MTDCRKEPPITKIAEYKLENGDFLQDPEYRNSLSNGYGLFAKNNKIAIFNFETGQSVINEYKDPANKWVPYKFPIKLANTHYGILMLEPKSQTLNHMVVFEGTDLNPKFKIDMPEKRNINKYFFIACQSTKNPEIFLFGFGYELYICNLKNCSQIVFTGRYWVSISISELSNGDFAVYFGQQDTLLGKCFTYRINNNTLDYTFLNRTEFNFPSNLHGAVFRAALIGGIISESPTNPKIFRTNINQPRFLALRSDTEQNITFSECILENNHNIKYIRWLPDGTLWTRDIHGNYAQHVLSTHNKEAENEAKVRTMNKEVKITSTPLELDSNNLVAAIHENLFMFDPTTQMCSKYKFASVEKFKEDNARLITKPTVQHSQELIAEATVLPWSLSRIIAEYAAEQPQQTKAFTNSFAVPLHHEVKASVRDQIYELHSELSWEISRDIYFRFTSTRHDYSLTKAALEYFVSLFEDVNKPLSKMLAETAEIFPEQIAKIGAKIPALKYTPKLEASSKVENTSLLSKLPFIGKRS